MAKQILILPGDGVGKEVSTSAVEVLDYFISEENLDFCGFSMIFSESFIRDICFEETSLKE